MIKWISNEDDEIFGRVWKKIGIKEIKKKKNERFALNNLFVCSLKKRETYAPFIYIKIKRSEMHIWMIKYCI